MPVPPRVPDRTPRPRRRRRISLLPLLAVRAPTQRWGIAAAVTCALALVLGLWVAPADAVQGDAQRLMYLHVPAVWAAYLCFFGVFLCSLGYLHKRNLHWDHMARACGEVGVALTALTIATGMIWGSLTWGTWWTWDARLVGTAAMFLVYIGYLAVRHLAAHPRQGARWAAIVGLAGVVTVPFVHLSVHWWRTLHQPPTILGPTADPPIHPLMALALGVSLLAVTISAGWAISRRYAVTARLAARSPYSVVASAAAARQTGPGPEE